MTLSEYFKANPKAAIAFSGGVDSAYLLYSALLYGAEVKAYYVKSAFQPEFELDDAGRIADFLHTKLSVIELDILREPQVIQNTQIRCYYCKKAIMGHIIQEAQKDGYHLLLEGTNASDEVSDRPGMKALSELSIQSPLRICGLTKQEIRQKSKEAGLFTYNKPAYACLATRIPTGMEITKEWLVKTERAEGYLFSLGFRDFRVRLMNASQNRKIARIQIKKEQIPLLLSYREDVLCKLKEDYTDVVMDLEDRK